MSCGDVPEVEHRRTGEVVDHRREVEGLFSRGQNGAVGAERQAAGDRGRVSVEASDFALRGQVPEADAPVGGRVKKRFALGVAIDAAGRGDRQGLAVGGDAVSPTVVLPSAIRRIS